MDNIRIDKYNRAILYIADGSHGVISVDPACLQAAMLVKMLKLTDVEIRVIKYTIFTKLPILVIGKHTITDPEAIKRKLESVTNRLDEQYDSIYRSKILAYQNNYQYSLVQAQMSNSWGIEENSYETAKYYGKGIFFLFRFLFIRNLKRKMRKRMAYILNEGGFDITLEHKFTDVQWALHDIHTLLHEHTFLLGEIPSTTDAFICSQLAPALFFEYPNNRLGQIIESNYPMVAFYVRKFVKKYGRQSAESYNYVPPTPAEVEQKDLASLGLIIGTTTVVGAIMLGYAAWNGFFDPY